MSDGKSYAEWSKSWTSAKLEHKIYAEWSKAEIFFWIKQQKMFKNYLIKWVSENKNTFDLKKPHKKHTSQKTYKNTKVSLKNTVGSLRFLYVHIRRPGVQKLTIECLTHQDHTQNNSHL